jgi:undecaprenyl-diphosphatase
LLAGLVRTRSIKAYVFVLALFVTFAVGFSRAYLGAHWPSDVLGGWAAGGAWAALGWLAAHVLQRLGWLERFSI